MDEILKLVGNQIRMRRKGLGLTQDALAEMIGTSQSYVGSIERGEQNVTLVSLKRIADALNVTINDLLPYDTDDTEGASEYILNQIMCKLRHRPVREQQFTLQFLDNLINLMDD